MCILPAIRTSRTTLGKRSFSNGEPLSPENYATLLERAKGNPMTPEIRGKQRASRAITLAEDRAAMADIGVGLRDVEGIWPIRVT